MNMLETGKGKYDEKVIKFVDTFWKEYFRPPSIREIGKACGISSTSVVSYVLHRLTRDGKYFIYENVARGIVPVWVSDAIKAATQPMSR